MALFDFLKSDEKKTKQSDTVEVKEFTKVGVETQNVVGELKKVSTMYKIPLRMLDFRILKVKTFYKKEGNNLSLELKEEEKEEFVEETNILNSSLKMHQVLRVEIFKVDLKSKIPLTITLGGNQNLTKVIATIKEQEIVKYFDNLEEEIIVEIDKKRAKLGILIGLFDHGLRDEVKRVVSNIRVNLSVIEDITFTVCESLDSISHVFEENIFLYQNKASQGDRVDHSNRGYKNAVKKGDRVIEVIKPREGKNGRNLKGEIINVGEFKATEVTKITVGKDIEIVDESDRNVYIAKKDGFIYEIEPNKFDIQDELIVNEATFRTTGSVIAGDDKDIKINIQDSDYLKDSIGSGVHIDTAEIRANGNVGSGAVLNAQIIEIGGQTHQSATLSAKKIKINIHKGFAEADEIEINSLEAGRVVADVVRINKISGGEVFAKEIYIDTLMSNSKLVASHLIQIERTTGTSNSFIIDSTAQRGFSKKVDMIQKEQKDTAKSIEKLKSQIKKYRFKIQKDKESIDAINKRVKEFTQERRQLPSAFIIKLKSYQKLIKDHNNLLEELKDTRYKQKELSDKLLEIQLSVLKAKIVHNASWKEFNEVKFRILNPPTELKYTPKKDELLREITIDEDNEGGYKIKRKT